MAHNPYAAPVSNVTAGDSYSSGSDIAASTVNILRMTKGWARFLSIIAFIVGAVLLVVCLIGLSDSEEFANNLGAFGPNAEIIGTIVLIIYVVLTVLFYIIPAIVLWSYANKTAYLIANPSTITLDTALNGQRLFFKYFGILFIVMLSLLALLWLWSRA